MSNEDQNDDVMAQIKKEIADLEETVEDLPDLPTPEEAEMGTLHRLPGDEYIGDVDTAEGQARRAEQAADLEPPEATDEDVREALEGVQQTCPICEDTLTTMGCPSCPGEGGVEE